MRLLNLEIKNWSCHSHLNIPLADGLQIEGRNGTGKSSILDAIRFIFSESARGYKNKIKNGTRSSTVRLEFESDGNRYIVEKRLFLDKSSISSMLLDSTQIADNQSTVYRKLQEILSEKILDKLLYVPQGGLTELIVNLQRMGGRQELDSLLGLDRLERVYEGARKELVELKAKSDLRREELRRYPENADKEYERDIIRIEKENKRLKRDMDIRLEEKKILESEIKKLKEKIKNLQKVKRDIDGMERELNQLRLQITEKKKDIESINQRLEDIEKRKKEIGGLEVDKKRLEKYTIIKKLLSELELKREKLDSIGNIEEIKEKLEGEKREISQWDGIREEYNEESNRILEIERKIAAKREKLRETEEYLERLSGLEGEARCPRCGQKLTKEHIETESNIAENKISELKATLNSLNDRLSERRSRLEKLENDLESWRNRRITTERLEADLREKIREQKSIKDSITAIEMDLKNSGYGDEDIDTVDERVSQLNKLQERIFLFRNEIKREKEYMDKKKGIENELFNMNERKAEIEDRLSRLEYDEKELSMLEERRDMVQEKFYNVMNLIERIKLQIHENESKARELREKRDEFLELKRKNEELDKEIALMEEARDIFHTNKGIVKYLREKYIAQLSNLLTYYFKRINQNPIYRNILFDKDYNIIIKTVEGEFELDQLSGGEKAQVALALRIALIDLLSSTRLLILDEPFGSLDKEHREVLGEALNKVAGDGQLIIVTHITVDSLNLPHKLNLGGY